MLLISSQVISSYLRLSKIEQKGVRRQTIAEAEYMSLTMTGIWMNRLLAEMNVEKEPFNPVTPYEDSQLGFLFHSSMDAASTLIEGNISSEMRSIVTSSRRLETRLV